MATQLREIQERMASLAVSVEDDRRVADLLWNWRASQVTEDRLKHRTILQYGHATDSLIAGLGETKVSEMTTSVVHRVMDGIARGSRPSVYSVLSTALRWLDRTGSAPGISACLPKKRPKSRRRERVLSDPEFVLMLRAFGEARRKRWAGWQMIDALTIMVTVPLRAGECAALRWDEVDLVSGGIWLYEAKTGDRYVPLSNTAIEILSSHHRRGPFVWAPARRPNSHVRVDGLSKAFKRICRRFGHGLETMNLHQLRHSWASKAIRDGASMEHVRRIMGHTTEWMSARYVHVGDSELRRTLQRIDDEVTRGFAVQTSLFRGEG